MIKCKSKHTSNCGEDAKNRKWNRSKDQSVFNTLELFRFFVIRIEARESQMSAAGFPQMDERCRAECKWERQLSVRLLEIGLALEIV